MKRLERSLLFLGKEGDQNTQRALDFCRLHFSRLSAHLGSWGEPLPNGVREWEGDYIISYLSRWVVPEGVLQRARMAAINFHPAPPEYPGIGCNNFALYENAQQYGVTCHHMATKVDTGAIIAVERFPVFSEDDVASLLSRTHDFQLVLFYKIVSLIASGEDLPTSSERWTRTPFTRKEFNELCRISTEMSREEIEKRIRATSFGHWRPTIEIHGYSFSLNEDKKA